jgi:hypothetical protein
MVTFLIALGIVGFAAVGCVKAVMSARLLEQNPEAWQKLRAAEFEKHQRQQEMVGNAALQGIRWFSSLLKKE